MRHVKQTCFIAVMVIMVLTITCGAMTNQNEITQDTEFTSADIEFGYLSEGEYELYSFVVWANAEKITLTLNGPSTGDFDLYANYGSEATPGYSDYSSEGLTSYEQITISNPSSGTWYTSVYAYEGYGSYSLTLNVDYEETTTSTSTTTTGSSGGSGGGSSSSTSSRSTSTPYTQDPYTEETSSSQAPAASMSVASVAGYVLGGGILGLVALYIIRDQMNNAKKKKAASSEAPTWGSTRYSGPSTYRSTYKPRDSYSPPRRDYSDTLRPGERYQPPKRYRPDEDDAPEWG